MWLLRLIRKTGRPYNSFSCIIRANDTSAAAAFLDLPVRHFETDDAKLAYRRAGEGPPLLLVHGWPLWGFTFRKMLPEARRHFECVMVDLPGMGSSDWNRATDLSFPAQARRLKALVDSLGWNEYNLLAHDTGATIARFLALGDRRVRRFVLINTEIPDHRLPWVPLYRRLSYLPGSALGFRLLLDSRMFLRSPPGFGGSFVDLNLIDGDFRDHFLRPLVSDSRRLAGAMRYIQQGLDYPLIDTLRDRHKEIEAECLFVWGSDDPTFPEPRARDMSEQFSHLRAFHSIPDARLFPQEEKPDEVNRFALPFLSGA